MLASWRKNGDCLIQKIMALLLSHRKPDKRLAKDECTPSGRKGRGPQLCSSTHLSGAFKLAAPALSSLTHPCTLQVPMTDTVQPLHTHTVISCPYPCLGQVGAPWACPHPAFVQSAHCGGSACMAGAAAAPLDVRAAASHARLQHWPPHQRLLRCRTRRSRYRPRGRASLHLAAGALAPRPSCPAAL